MKKILALLLAVSPLFSPVAKADPSELRGRILTAACGELDPFVIGDACLVILELAPDRNVVLVSRDFDLADALDTPSLEDFEGRDASIPYAALEKIESAEILDELHRHDDTSVGFYEIKDVNAFRVFVR
jgi:hypothetical protein